LSYARILPIKGLLLLKVHYYTICIDDEDSQTTEFVDFITRMNEGDNNKKELQELIVRIKKIGNDYGALKHFFHHEAAADALSVPVEHIDIESELNDFGLRLYCIRLSESTVILLNGARKTAQKVQDCPNCYKHFQMANKIAKAIDKAISEKEVVLIGKELEQDENFELIF